jgi:ribosomal protein S18 acetylase RimI-like enzyme
MITPPALPIRRDAPPVRHAATDPGLGIRLAVAADIPDLAGVLARAFAADPWFRYVTAGAADPRERMRAGWTGILRYGSARLVATDTTADLSGVAVWLPPGEIPRSRIDSLRLVLAMARLRGWRRVRSVSDAVREVDERRSRHAPGPHVYLQALAVDVGRQGRGIGTALMGATLERCDAAGLPACLETANPRSLPFYRRLGFEVVDELTIGVAGVDCWILRRSPRTRA